MTKNWVKNGLFASLAAIVLNLAIYAINTDIFITWGSLLAWIPMIYFMAKAALDERNEQNGFISFKSAFSESWLAYLVYAILTTLFTYVLFNFIDPNLQELTKEIAIKAMEKVSGFLGEEGTSKAIEEIENGNQFGLAKLFLGAVFSLVFPGAVVALIIALIVKKEKPFDWIDPKANETV